MITQFQNTLKYLSMVIQDKAFNMCPTKQFI